uniref:beta-glucosidase n=1 Tax=Araucaria cunninghamii TaxID=56994 RepID=A0A0D6R1T5_ARACU
MGFRWKLTRVLIQCSLVLMMLLLGEGVEEHGVFSRKSFPQGFVFGTSSSAYQYEGAVAEDGRKPSICDTYYDVSSHTVDGSNANVTVNQYDLYPGDIEMMAALGLDAYRLSISWSRLIPDGRGAVNPLAVEHYNTLLTKLLDCGVEPYVTLSHFDIPQALQDEYGGWLNRRIVDDFANYANVCFTLFGDKVKHWITINEPNLQASLGYDLGIFPPGRCSSPFGNCSQGNSSTEPYIAAHYQLLSHASAVAIFRKNKATKNSSIGFPINQFWYEPLTNRSEDVEAQSRVLDFTVGWIFDPIFFGDYPRSMRKIVGPRLPNFTKKEVEMLKGSVDFIALNHYTSLYVAAKNSSSSTVTDYYDDMSVKLTGVRDGVLIGPKTAYDTEVMTLYIVPSGIKFLVEYVSKRYNNPQVFILENGVATANSSLIDALNDRVRVNFHRDYLSNLLEAIENGANVKGYFMWSLLDNFEFDSGFTLRFGLLYVDFKQPGLQRYPKLSALWFHQFLKQNTTLLTEGQSTVHNII